MKTRNPRIAIWVWILGALCVLDVTLAVIIFSQVTSYVPPVSGQKPPVRSDLSGDVAAATYVPGEDMPPDAVGTIEVPLPPPVAVTTMEGRVVPAAEAPWSWATRTAHAESDSATFVAVATADAQATIAASATAQALATPTCSPAWKIVDNPDLDLTDSSSLNAVAAVSADDVWAAGHYGPRTLVEHWDGNSWRVVDSPSDSREGQNALESLFALSADDVWALGRRRPSPYESGSQLIEHWDGSQWSLLPNPENEELIAVVAVSPQVTWVGSSGLLNWDGTRWNKVDLPPPGDVSGPRPGGPALSPYDAWKSGSTMLGMHNTMFTLSHWDGQQWNDDAAGSGRGTYTGAQQSISGIAAISPDDVWAAGAFAGMGGIGAYLLHRQGGPWSETALDDPHVTGRDVPQPQFNGITALSANDVWAVGIVWPLANGESGTLAAHWDGNSWRVVPTANSPACDCGSLEGVAAVAPDDIWAVGSLGHDTYRGTDHALIEHLDHAVGSDPQPDGCVR
jgi:hypothetical protein